MLVFRMLCRITQSSVAHRTEQNGSGKEVYILLLLLPPPLYYYYYYYYYYYCDVYAFYKAVYIIV